MTVAPWKNKFESLSNPEMLAIIMGLEIKLAVANINAKRYEELSANPILHYDVSLCENDDGELPLPILVIGDNCVYNGNMQLAIDKLVDERIAMRKLNLQQDLEFDAAEKES